MAKSQQRGEEGGAQNVGEKKRKGRERGLGPGSVRKIEFHVGK